MHRTVVLDVVGLTPAHLGPHTPHLSALAAAGAQRPLVPVLPAVTCSVQSTFITGALPRVHGCVANGWYFRDLAEIWLWRQSNHLVGGEKLWDVARRRDPAFSVATMFWWYNMYAAVDASVTPRPMYPADGRKLPDVYTQPASLRDELNAKLGTFPLFHFWGPTADIVSSRWIADASRHVYDTRRPTLMLVYLPHLDYCLQKRGPGHRALPAELRAIDAICGELIDHVQRDGTRVVVLSEYGITAVRGAVHPNRALREAGFLAVREEQGREQLDAGASEAFAVADHQLAHVYVRRPELVGRVADVLKALPGVAEVLDEAGKRAAGLDHARSGELVAIAAKERWFTYYHWLDDARAPDFARTVEIHRKSGYDPVELFLDPTLRAPALSVAWRLAKKSLGFRTLMDLIPLDASLVRGSHGRLPDTPDEGPLLLSSEPALVPEGAVHALAVRDLLLGHVFDA